MAKIYRYAIKYLDRAGYTAGYGYAESMDRYDDGEIISVNGQKIKIDFELSPKTSTAGCLVQII